MTLGPDIRSDGRFIPTPDGKINYWYPSGDDSGPPTPLLSKPSAISETVIRLSLVTFVLPIPGVQPFTYEVYKKLLASSIYTLHASGIELLSSGTYDITGLTPGATYNIRVRIKDAADKFSSFWESGNVVMPDEPAPPPVPSQITGLAVSDITSSSIVGISWNADSDATEYVLVAGLGNGENAELPGTVFLSTTIQAPTTSFAAIVDRPSDQQHYIKVAGINASGQGPFSATLFVTTDPTPTSEPADFIVRQDGAPGSIWPPQLAIDAAAVSPGGGNVVIECQTVVPGVPEDWNVFIRSVRSGAPGQYIVLRAREGDKIRLTGTAGFFGDSTPVGWAHSWLDWGKGIVAKGAMPWNTNPTKDGVKYLSGANNNIDQFSTEECGSRTHAVDGNNIGTRITGGYSWWHGTVDKGDLDPIPGRHSDGGDGIQILASNAGVTIDRQFLYAGGHGLIAVNNGGGNILSAYNWVDSLWDAVFDWNHPEGSPGADRDGNRVSVKGGGFGQDAVVARSIYGPKGRTWEINQWDGPVYRNTLRNVLMHTTLVHGESEGGPGYTTGASLNNEYDAQDGYYCHNVYANTWGAAFFATSTYDIANRFGPFHLKNEILFNVNINPAKNEFDGDFCMAYFSARDNWQDLIFIDHCGFFSSNSMIRIKDRSNILPDVFKTIAQMQIDYPTNFHSNVFGDPQFVDSSTPRVPHKTYWNESLFNAARQKWAPQNPIYLGTAIHLTTVTANVAGNVSVPIADLGWIAAYTIGGSRMNGDPIFNYYIEGHGVVQFSSKASMNGPGVATATAPVTCSSGARIWLGTVPNPNMGMIL